MHELADAFSKLIPIYPHCKLILVGNFEDNLDPLQQEDKVFFENNPAVHFVGYQDGTFVPIFFQLTHSYSQAIAKAFQMLLCKRGQWD